MSGRNIIHLAVSRSGHSMVRENMVSWTKHLKDVHIFNFESVDPNRFYKVLQAKISRQNIKPDTPTTYVIQVRDLLNWWASLLMYRAKNHMDISDRMNNEMLSIWKGIAEEGFGVTNLINSDDKHLCVFEEFIHSRVYREDLCRAIGGKYNEEMLNHVPNAGGGSSFDGFVSQDAGSKMKIDTRYVEMQDIVLENWYRWTLAKNLDVVRAYEAHFNISPIQKTFLFNKVTNSSYAKQKSNLKGTALPTKGMRALIKFTKASRNAN